LLSKYVGESEKALRDVFRTARQAAPCIIFFEEIDALVPARAGSSSDSRVGERVLSQFLAEFDGVEELRGVLVLGATNRIDLLDPAILRPGRFDELIEIPLPDEEGRKEIFAVYLREKPLEAEIDLADLAARADSFSGAEIQAVCTRAALRAVRRVIAGAKPEGSGESRVLIGGADLDIAIEEVRRR
jgi:transitional endoplasmic reticulum ATPase